MFQIHQIICLLTSTQKVVYYFLLYTFWFFFAQVSFTLQSPVLIIYIPHGYSKKLENVDTQAWKALETPTSVNILGYIYTSIIWMVYIYVYTENYILICIYLEFE